VEKGKNKRKESELAQHKHRKSPLCTVITERLSHCAIKVSYELVSSSQLVELAFEKHTPLVQKSDAWVVQRCDGERAFKEFLYFILIFQWECCMTVGTADFFYLTAVYTFSFVFFPYEVA